MKASRRLKTGSRISKYLPILIMLLAFTIMAGTTFAYFSDRGDNDGQLTFSKVELSSDTQVGVDTIIYDAIPGSQIIDNAIQFSKSIDSEAMYVRAKLSFSLSDDLTEAQKVNMTPYLRALQDSEDFGVYSEEQHGAKWSNKQGNYYYLLTADGASFKVVDTVDTYLLANSISIPRALEQLDGYAQYFSSINFHIAFQAIQADNVSQDILNIKELFNSIFPEREAEVFEDVGLGLNFYDENHSSVSVRIPMAEEDVTVIPTNPTSSDENKVFDGWYLDKTFTTKYSFGNTISEALNLYPKYITATNPADFIFDGNTLVKYGGEDTDVIIPRYYSMSATPITRTVHIFNRYQYNEYVGAANLSYPLTVTYSNGRGTERLNSGAAPKYYPLTFEVNTYFTYAKGDGNDIAVTAIGQNGFYDATHINTLLLHDGITTIGARAFQYLTGVTFLEIPTSVKSVGASVFANNYKLREIYNRSNVELGVTHNTITEINSLKDSKLYTYNDGNVEWVFYDGTDSVTLVGYKNVVNRSVTTPAYGITANKLYSTGDNDGIIIDEYNLNATFEYSDLDAVRLSNTVNQIDDYAFAYYLGFVIDATDVGFAVNCYRLDNLQYYLMSNEIYKPTISEDLIYIKQEVDSDIKNAVYGERNCGDYYFGETILDTYYYLEIADGENYKYYRSINPIAQTMTGSGAQNDPYVISNVYQWKDFAARVNEGDDFYGKYVVLNKDINFNSTTNWESWSKTNGPTNSITDFAITRMFNGNLDGQGNSLQGIYYVNSNQDSQVALFSYLEYNAEIKNLNIDKSYFSGCYVAAFAIDSNAIIDNCNINANVEGEFASLFVVNNYREINNCEIYGSVKGNECAFAFAQNNTLIQNSVFIGKLNSVNSSPISSSGRVVDTYAIVTFDNKPSALYPVSTDNPQNSYALINVDYNVVSTTYNIINKQHTFALVEESEAIANLDYSEVLDFEISDTYEYYKYIRVPNTSVRSASQYKYYKSIIQYLNGEGSEQNPYTISNLAEWNIFANIVKSYQSNVAFDDKYISLTQDIVVNDTTNYNAWSVEKAPINVKEFVTAGDAHFHSFGGIFNGNNHTISGIYLNKHQEYMALFANLTEGIIKNLNVKKSFFANEMMTAAIVCDNNGVVENCVFEGKIVCPSSAGLVMNNNGTIVNSINLNSVSTEFNPLFNYSSGEMLGAFAITDEEYATALTKDYKNKFYVYAYVSEVDETVSGAEYTSYIVDDLVVAYTNELIDRYGYVKVTKGGVVKYYKCLVSMLKGSGTEIDPYLVESLEDWNKFAGLVNDGNSFKGQYVSLANDIVVNDISDYDNWSDTVAPENLADITIINATFEGVFDGNGNSITGLYLYYDMPLFGDLGQFGAIRNVIIDKAYISGYYHIAGFVNTNNGIINDCVFEGKIVSEQDWLVGGFAITNNNTIADCVFIGLYNAPTKFAFAESWANTPMDSYMLVNDTQENLREKNYNDSNMIYYNITNTNASIINANYKYITIGDITIGTATIFNERYVKVGDKYYREINAKLENFTPNETFVIDSIEDWNTFATRIENRDTMAGVLVELDCDLTFNDTTDWETWNTEKAPSESYVVFNNLVDTFEGVFDGKNHALKGIYSVNNNNGFAVFLHLAESGVVKNLTISQSYIYSSMWTSGLVQDNNGTIQNVTIDANIFANDIASGLVNFNTGIIQNSVVKGAIGGNVVNGVVDHGNGFIDLVYVEAALNGNDVNGVGNSLENTISNNVIMLNCETANNFYPLSASYSEYYIYNTYLLSNIPYDECNVFTNSRQHIYGLITADNAIKGLDYSELVIGNQTIKISKVHEQYKYVCVGENYYKSLEMKLDGNGSESNPYLISNAQDWSIFASMVNAGNTFSNQYVALGNDITFNDSSNYETWGIDNPPEFVVETLTGTFAGIFDGKNYTLEGVCFNNSQALFAYLSDFAVIKNLHIIKSYMYNTSNIAGLVYSNNGNIDNCTLQAKIVSNSTYATGFVYSNNGTIEDCKFTGSVTSNGIAVGLVNSNNGTIANCEVVASITATNNAIGLTNTCHGDVSSCVVDVTLSATNVIGFAGSFGNYSNLLDCVIFMQIDSIANVIYPIVRSGSGVFDSSYAILEGNYSDIIGKLQSLFNVYVLVENAGDEIKQLSYSSTNIGNFVLGISEIYNQYRYLRITNDDDYSYYKGMLVELVGDGSEENPYLITNIDTWNAFASRVNGGETFEGQFIALGNDIEFNDTTDFESWNNANAPANLFARISAMFSGTFDGKDYALNGIYSTGTTVSIFSTLNATSVIKDLNVSKSYFYSTSTAAILATTNNGEIKNININVKAEARIVNGVLNTNNGNIEDVVINLDAYSLNRINAIASSNRGNISNIEICGTLKADSIVSAMVQTNNLVISNCKVTATLNAPTIYGIATQLNGEVINCYINPILGGNVTNIYPIAQTVSVNTTNCYFVVDETYEDAIARGFKSFDSSFALIEADDVVKELEYSEITIMDISFGVSETEDATYLRVESGESYNYYQLLVLGGMKGSGTKDDPYVINNVNDWNLFASIVNGGNTLAGQFIELGKDIIFNDYTDWEDWNSNVRPTNLVSISHITSAFAGTFDGKDYSLKGIYLNTTSNTGLFTNLDSLGTIKNLNINNSYLYSSMNMVGLVYTNHGTIQGCEINANIEGRMALGVTYTNHGTIDDCDISGSIVAINRAMGISNTNSGSISGIRINATLSATDINGITYANNGDLKCISVLGNLVATNRAYLLVYNINSGSSINDCYVDVNVSASTIVGVAYRNNGGNVESTLINISLDNTPNMFYSFIQTTSTGEMSNIYLLLDVDYNTSFNLGLSVEDDVYALAGEVSKDIQELEYMEAGFNNNIIEISSAHKDYIYIKVPGDQDVYYKSLSTAGTGQDGNEEDVGTEDNPYVIESLADWNNFANMINAGNTYEGKFAIIKQGFSVNDTSDFDLWSSTYAPANLVAFNRITGTFAGTLDGGDVTLDGIYIAGSGNMSLINTLASTGTLKNFKIKTSYIQSSSRVAGLVYTNQGTIDGLEFAGCTIESTGMYATGVAYQNQGTIKNARVNGKVNSSGTAACGIAYTNGGTITNCRVDGEVSAKTACGIANTNSGTITNSRVTCELTGTTAAWGLINNNNNSITDCIVTATLSGSRIAGIGYRLNGTTTNCVVNFTVSGTPTNVYPYASTEGVMENCYAVLEVVHTTALGLNLSTLTNVYALITTVSEEIEGLKYTETQSGMLNLGVSDKLNAYTYIRTGSENNYKYYKSLETSIAGTGTESDPFLISSVEDWVGFAAKVNGGNNYSGQFVALANDITFNDTTNYDSWTSENAPSNLVEFTRVNGAFNGTLDGKGYTLSGIYINYTGRYLGMFNSLHGTIKNLNVEKSHIFSTDRIVGFVNSVEASGVIEDCSINIDCTLSNSSDMYGLSFYNYGNIKSTSVSGKYNGYSACVLTYSNYGYIEDCYVDVVVESSYCFGVTILYSNISNTIMKLKYNSEITSFGIIDVEQSNTVKTNCVCLVADSYENVTQMNISNKSNLYAKVTADDAIQTLTYTKATYGGVDIELSTTYQYYKYIRIANGDGYDYFKSLDNMLNGSGTEEDPYTIANLEEWNMFEAKVNSGSHNENMFSGMYFLITNDIVFNDTTNWESWTQSSAPESLNVFTPIGDMHGARFGGILNGNNHSISGIYFASYNDYFGIFGYTSNSAEINNLIIEKSYIYTSGHVSSRAGLVAYNYGTINNCIVNIKFGVSTSEFDSFTVSALAANNYGTINNTITIDAVNEVNNSRVYPFIQNNSGAINRSFAILNENYNNAIMKNYYNNAMLYALLENPDTSITGATYSTYKIGTLTIGYTTEPVNDFNYVYINDGTTIKYYKSLLNTLDGSGTKEDPYTISSIDDWNKFALQVQGGNSFSGQFISLTQSLTFNDTTNFENWSVAISPDNMEYFNMAGYNTFGFGGEFYGNGNSLNGIYLVSDSSYAGIFARLNAGAIVADLSVTKSLIIGRSTAGGIAGYSQGLINNVTFEGGVFSTNSNGNVYGIAGGSSGSTVTNALFIASHVLNDTNALANEYTTKENCFTITNENISNALGAGYEDTTTTYALVDGVDSTVTNANYTSVTINGTTIETATVSSINYVRYNSKYYRDLNLTLSGSGTSTNPYKISSTLDWNIFVNMTNTNNKYFELTNDIIFNNTDSWQDWNDTTKPENLVKAGTRTEVFYGRLDGRGYALIGMYVEIGSSSDGLLQSLQSSVTINNLSILNSCFVFNNSSYTGIFGNGNYGTISNVTITANIYGRSSYLGGLTGRNQGTISNVTMNVNMNTNSSYIGGITPVNDGTITGCKVIGEIRGSYMIYGIAPGTVTDCIYNGKFTGSNIYVIGNGNVTNSYGLVTTSKTYQDSVNGYLLINEVSESIVSLSYNAITLNGVTSDKYFIATNGTGSVVRVGNASDGYTYYQKI